MTALDEQPAARATAPATMGVATMIRSIPEGEVVMLEWNREPLQVVHQSFCRHKRKRVDINLNALYITPNDGKTVESYPQSDGADTIRVWGIDPDDGQLSGQNGARRDDSDAANGVTHNLGGAGGRR